MASSAPHPQARAFIFVTVLLDTIGLGVIIPVVPELIRTLDGGSLADAARISGWLMFSYSVMQFACGPVVGALSDRFGRRPVLLASLLAFSADFAIAAFAPTLFWLFLARIVAGVTGASFTIAYAYLADVTPKAERAAAFSRVGLAFGLGFVIGPALGGLVADWGVRAPFLLAAALALLNAAWGWFVLPESLPPERRRPIEWRRANPVGALARLHDQSPYVLVLAGAVFVWMLGHFSLQATWNFSGIARFGWSEAEVGWSLAAVGLVSIIVQGGLAKRLIARFGEARLVWAGCVSAILAFLIYAGAVETWQMYAGIAVYALGGMVFPSIQGLMSGATGEREQGELQGAVSSLMSLAAITGPPLMTQVFAAFNGPAAPFALPGAPFLLAALFTVGTMALFAWASRKRAPQLAPGST